MYWEYFGFEENPFSISPDPRYLFMSKRHQEALAHLLYGVREGGGFVLLTGEVGTGKTTICRCLIEELPENVELAFVLNPRVDETELLATICDELNVAGDPAQSSLKALVDRLNAHLLDAHARGRQPVLLIDEAQNLSPSVLEQVRLLTNLETTTRKLLQIILVGQPELNDVLSRQSLRQLDQRITARYHLRPLERAETAAYIVHRLAVAGTDQRIFTAGAVREVFRISKGVPRLINTLCDRCLLGAYAENKQRVNARLVRRAATEVMGARAPGGRRGWRGWLLATAAAAAVATLMLAEPLRDGLAERLRELPLMARLMAEMAPAEVAEDDDAEFMLIDTAAGPAPAVEPGPSEVALVVSPPPPPPAFADDGEPKPEHANDGEPKPEHADNGEPKPEHAGDGEPKPEHADDGEPMAERANDGQPATDVAEAPRPGEPRMAPTVLPMSEPPRAALAGAAAVPRRPAPSEPAAGLAAPVDDAPPPVAETDLAGALGTPLGTPLAEPAPVELASLGLPLPDIALPETITTRTLDDEPPAVLEPAALLHDEATVGGLESALTAVFRRWRFDYADLKGVTPCKRARYANLRCLQGQATWHELRSHDRPAVITLLGPGGERRHAALLRLRDQRATVAIDGHEIETTLAELSAIWTGDYLLFWRSPPTFTREMQQGQQGADIAWLAARFGSPAGESVDAAGEAIFDAALVDRVQAFQREHGLVVDGIVGARTMMRLATAGGDAGDMPRLR